MWPSSYWRRGLAHDLAASQRLAHLVGVNGFFTALLRSARTRPGCRLEEWWSERRCAREWGEVVRPDGYGVWVDHGASMPFLARARQRHRTPRSPGGQARRVRQARRGRGSPQLGALHLPHTAP